MAGQIFLAYRHNNFDTRFADTDCFYTFYYYCLPAFRLMWQFLLQKQFGRIFFL